MLRKYVQKALPLSVVPKSPREKAARTLCRMARIPEDSEFNGKPMWMIFLPEADAVLEAALPPEEWERLRDEEWEQGR